MKNETQQPEDRPADALPVDAEQVPERHEPGETYDKEDADKTFFQAKYDVDETREEDPNE